jgi:hypothetical protein
MIAIVLPHYTAAHLAAVERTRSTSAVHGPAMVVTDAEAKHRDKGHCTTA